MARIRFVGPTVILLIVVLVAMIVGPHTIRQIEWARTDARVALIRNDLSQSEFLAQLSQAFRDVARSVEPSVVSVQIFVQPRRTGGTRLIQAGNGSGWVYDEKGHVITNHHVVAPAHRIVVRFANGAEYEAELIHADVQTDIAVLKVDADYLHPARIAEEPVQQGDMVFAFGSPFQFEFSMSQGIVSGMGRRLGALERSVAGYEWFIQTDASINPGNSGGPLTNIFGQVVGMNTAIASRDGTFDGVGFAIPVNLVRKVVDQIVTTGEMRRGFLGIVLPERELDYRIASSLGVNGKGVMIRDVSDPQSPAADAGLQAGDIIVRVEGEPMRSVAHLRYSISTYPPGTEIELDVFRDGDRMSVTATLAELPEQRTFRPHPMLRMPVEVEEEPADAENDR